MSKDIDYIESFGPELGEMIKDMRQAEARKNLKSLRGLLRGHNNTVDFLALYVHNSEFRAQVVGIIDEMKAHRDRCNDWIRGG